MGTCVCNVETLTFLAYIALWYLKNVPCARRSNRLSFWFCTWSELNPFTRGVCVFTNQALLIEVVLKWIIYNPKLVVYIPLLFHCIDFFYVKRLDYYIQWQCLMCCSSRTHGPCLSNSSPCLSLCILGARSELCVRSEEGPRGQTAARQLSRLSRRVFQLFRCRFK